MAKKEKENTEHKAPVWYLAGPFYRYNEDVKALARSKGIRIIDANVTDDRGNEATDVPKVTLKSEFQPKVAEKAEKK